jgi:hypothetical protein
MKGCTFNYYATLQMYEGLHVRLLGYMTDVQCLDGNPSNSCYLIKAVYSIVSLKYITLLFTIRAWSGVVVKALRY